MGKIIVEADRHILYDDVSLGNLERSQSVHPNWHRIDDIISELRKTGPFKAVLNADIAKGQIDGINSLNGRNIHVWTPTTTAGSVGVAVIGARNDTGVPSVYFVRTENNLSQIFSTTHRNFLSYFSTQELHILSQIRCDIANIDQLAGTQTGGKTILLGRTSSGKTSYALYVTGADLRGVKNRRNEGYMFDGEGIGAGGTSQTRTVESHGEFVDLPGLFDTGGAITEVRNAYLIQKYSQLGIKLRVLLFLAADDLDANAASASNLKETLSAAGKILLNGNTAEQVAQVARIFHIVITKALPSTGLYAKSNQRLSRIQSVKESFRNIIEEIREENSQARDLYLNQMLQLAVELPDSRYNFFYQPEKIGEVSKIGREKLIDSNSSYESFRLGISLSAETRLSLTRAYRWLQEELNSRISDFVSGLDTSVQLFLQANDVTIPDKRAHINTQYRQLKGLLSSALTLLETANNLIDMLKSLAYSYDLIEITGQIDKYLGMLVNNERLRDLSSDFDFNLNLSALRSLSDALRVYSESPHFKEEDNSIVLNSDGIVQISDLDSYLEHYQKHFSMVTRVRLLANHILIDKSLNLPGITLELKGAHLYWSEGVRIDLSGIDGIDLQRARRRLARLTDPDRPAKASSARIPPAIGENGLPGLDGGDSGHLYLNEIRFYRGAPSQLEVILNGGQGEPGQEGGDGANGRCGKNGDGKYWMKVSVENERASSHAITTQIVEAVKFFVAPIEVIPSRWISPGEPGEPGTDAGRGGPGGKGGQAGLLKVDGEERSPPHPFALTQSSGNPGAPGLHGKIGKGGKHGNDLEQYRYEYRFSCKRIVCAGFPEVTTVAFTGGGVTGTVGAMLGGFSGAAVAGVAGGAIGALLGTMPLLAGGFLQIMFRVDSVEPRLIPSTERPASDGGIRPENDPQARSDDLFLFDVRRRVEE